MTTHVGIAGLSEKTLGPLTLTFSQKERGQAGWSIGIFVDETAPERQPEDFYIQ